MAEIQKWEKRHSLRRRFGRYNLVAAPKSDTAKKNRLALTRTGLPTLFRRQIPSSSRFDQNLAPLNRG
jgi:hypothetical protein